MTQNGSVCNLQAIQAVDPETAARLAETFQVLGDATRLRIVSALRGGECCVHCLAEALSMSQSAISHQLRLLRTLRIVRARKEGRNVFYALDDDHVLALLAQGLDHVSHS